MKLRAASMSRPLGAFEVVKVRAISLILVGFQELLLSDLCHMRKLGRRLRPHRPRITWMKKRQTSKYALITKLSEEAALLIMPTAEWQRRMFRVATINGRDNEPVGLLAGRNHPDSKDKSDR